MEGVSSFSPWHQSDLKLVMLQYGIFVSLKKMMADEGTIYSTIFV